MYEEILNETRRLEAKAGKEGYTQKYRRYLNECEYHMIGHMTEVSKHVLIFLKYLNNHHILKTIVEEDDAEAAIAYVTVEKILKEVADIRYDV